MTILSKIMKSTCVYIWDYKCISLFLRSSYQETENIKYCIRLNHMKLLIFDIFESQNENFTWFKQTVTKSISIVLSLDYIREIVEARVWFQMKKGRVIWGSVSLLHLQGRDQISSVKTWWNKKQSLDIYCTNLKMNSLEEICKLM